MFEWDEAKRASNLASHGLDMADAEDVFDGLTITVEDDGLTITVEDDRFDYGETRFITVGFLAKRMVVLVWTPRGEVRRIISMRKANDREQAAYSARIRS